MSTDIEEALSMLTRFREIVTAAAGDEDAELVEWVARRICRAEDQYPDALVSEDDEPLRRHWQAYEHEARELLGMV